MTPAACAYCDSPCAIDSETEVAAVHSNAARFAHLAYAIWRCRTCGSINATDEVDLEDAYRDYPVKDLKLDYFLVKGYESRLRMLARHGLRGATRLLDYGSGGGQFVLFLQSRGFADSAGYDPYVPRFADRDVLAETRDMVVSFDVLEHAENPQAVFADMAARVRPGGILVLGTPNASEIDLRRAATFRFELHQPYHRHIASEEAMRILARRHSLEIIEWSRRPYFDTLWPGVNVRLLVAYVDAAGGCVESLLTPRPALALRSPRLLPYAFLGYFLRRPGNMTWVFRRPPERSAIHP